MDGEGVKMNQRKWEAEVEYIGLCSISSLFVFAYGKLEIHWFAYVYLIVVAHFVEMTIFLYCIAFESLSKIIHIYF